jgi:hypothetical protein
LPDNWCKCGKKFPEIKKDLKMFLGSEEAKISVKNALCLWGGTDVNIGCG